MSAEKSRPFPISLKRTTSADGGDAKVINYARNPEKTHDKERLSELHEIEGVVEYAADEMKTEKRAYGG